MAEKGQPCWEGQGDCDDDDHCAEGLICGHDNCKEFGNFYDDADCCIKGTFMVLFLLSNWVVLISYTDGVGQIIYAFLCTIPGDRSGERDTSSGSSSSSEEESSEKSGENSDNGGGGKGSGEGSGGMNG